MSSPFLVVAAVAAATATAAVTIAAAAVAFCHFKWKACCLDGHFIDLLLFPDTLSARDLYLCVEAWSGSYSNFG